MFVWLVVHNSTAISLPLNSMLDVCVALRKVEKHLGLEKLYVLGTNCGKHFTICSSESLLSLFHGSHFWVSLS